MRENLPDIGLPPETLTSSKNGEIFRGPILIRSRTNLQSADVIAPDFSRKLRPVVDRLRRSRTVQADPTAEKRIKNISRIAAEIKQTCTFEKECALFRK